MAETIQERIARQRAAREARDGTPEENRRVAAYAKTVRSMATAERKIRRIVRNLENSMGEQLPTHIRSKIF